MEKSPLRQADLRGSRSEECKVCIRPKGRTCSFCTHPSGRRCEPRKRSPRTGFSALDHAWHRGLKEFVLSLVIVDDVIALFYTDTLHLAWLLGSLAGFGLVAATVSAGVRTAPPRSISSSAQGSGYARSSRAFIRPSPASPLVRLESNLHAWVAFLIMPLFALANAGVPISSSALDEPIAVAAVPSRSRPPAPVARASPGGAGMKDHSQRFLV
jgi:hypothetical protein